MALYEDLERVKLRFIAVCETLLDQQRLTEEDFEKVLIMLEHMDDFDERQLDAALQDFNKGLLDLGITSI